MRSSCEQQLTNGNESSKRESSEILVSTSSAPSWPKTVAAIDAADSHSNLARLVPGGAVHGTPDLVSPLPFLFLVTPCGMPYATNVLESLTDQTLIRPKNGS